VKLVTFVERAGGAERVGAVVDGAVVEVPDGGRGLIGLLAAGPLEDVAPSGPSRALESVRLLAPLPRPHRIFALAGNFADHIDEGGEVLRTRGTPRVFSKPPSCVIGPDEPIRIPAISSTVDHELELAAIVGFGGSVAGYAVFNDVSARYLELPERGEPDEADGWYDFINGKWCDTFGPLGPWLVTADELEDVTALEMRLTVNGETRQSGSTGQMIFGVEEALAFVARLCALAPGDVIAMGTPAGTAIGTGKYLRPGDVVEATIEGLGTLRNPVE
jgi:2-keto-4-pentenoate hydratase/2-oxohepta-3-ene-1,7-dioic acid hydratase in catechol pathway